MKSWRKSLDLHRECELPENGSRGRKARNVEGGVTVVSLRNHRSIIGRLHAVVMAAERTVREAIRANSWHLCNWGSKLNNERVSSILAPSPHRRNRALLGGVCVIALAFAFGSSSA